MQLDFSHCLFFLSIRTTKRDVHVSQDFFQSCLVNRKKKPVKTMWGKRNNVFHSLSSSLRHARTQATAYNMFDKSLLTLPDELIYLIFDHLDIKTLLLSVRFVCKDLYEITNTYNQFKIDFNSLKYLDIRRIACLVQSENITELAASNCIDGSRAINLLQSDFNLSQFTRLNTFTLYKIKETDLVKCLRQVATTSLMSLTIDFKDDIKENNTIGALLSSIITQSNLQKLCLKYSAYMSRYVSLAGQCSLRYLAISNCTCREYLTVLIHCPHLRTFVIDCCIMSNLDATVFSSATHASHQQLRFLTIGDFQLPTECIKSFFSWTPSLTHLELTSLRATFDSIFDGFFWTQLIQNKLVLLDHLAFFVKCGFRSTNNFPSMKSIIASFQTPFWLTDKQWFVTCDYVINTSDIVLYTNSFRTTDDEVLIRYKALSVDHVDIFARSGTNDATEPSQKQVYIIFFFPR